MQVLGWIGGASQAILVTRGEARGGDALVLLPAAVDPRTRQFTLRDALVFREAAAHAYAEPVLPQVPADGALHDTLLALLPAEERLPQRIVARPLTRRGPRNTAMLFLASTDERAGRLPGVFAGACAAFAVHPGGNALCVAVSGRGDGGWLALEMAASMGRTPPPGGRTPLSGDGPRILAVAYAQRGDALLLARQRGSGFALEMTRRGNPGQAQSLFDGAGARPTLTGHPRAALGAVSYTGADGARRFAVAGPDPANTAHAMEGWAGPWPWRENGIVYLGPDAEGNAQVWQAGFDLESPRPLTALDVPWDGAAAEAAGGVRVSDDGRWALANVPGNRRTTLVLLDLDAAGA
jgi:hypothetical protein